MEKEKIINYFYETDEEDIKQLLIGRKVEKINYKSLQLDNGQILEIIPNEGCCCGSGCYDIEELNGCENVITNVELVDDLISEDSWGTKHSYKIFVYAENKKIKLLQVDGDDGNGYYGTGYEIVVKEINKEELEENED